MKYTKEELGFILYNNRSIKGVVNNFKERISQIRLITIERRLSEINNLYYDDDRKVEIDLSELDIDGFDVEYTKEDLSNLSYIFNDIKLSDVEYNFLINRGIDDEIINKYKITGLSNIKDKRILEIIGSTCHPVLNRLLSGDEELGGILIPLFENDILVNCSIRKIGIENSTNKKLKYSLSCPDLPVWGLDDLDYKDECWLTEGLFDMMAIKSLGEKCVSCSSAMWSSIQLYKLLDIGLSKINIFSDNDQVGIRTSGILKEFFIKNNIECDIYISECKDAAEHIFENKLDISNLSKIDVNNDLIISKNDDSFNFLEHMKNRKFN